MRMTTKANILTKKAMIIALEESLGVVTMAAKAVGIDRCTHYSWYNKDPEYKAAVDALTDIPLDFAENKLHSLIEKGDTAATIFFLKTKGRKRGYIEKQEVEHTGEIVIDFTHD